MKAIILIVCVFAYVTGLSEKYKNDMNDSIMQVASICVPESGANEDDIAELMDHKTPSRREEKCVIYCFQRHFEMLKDGKYDKDTTIAGMQDLKEDDEELYGKFVQAMENCDPELKSNPEQDLCEFAFISASCLHRESIKVGIDNDELMN